MRIISKPSIDRVGVGLVMLSSLGFSTLAILAKLAHAQNLNLLSVLAWRLGGATAVLWLCLLLRNQWQVKRQSAIAAFLLGASGYAIQAALFFSALAYASAGMTVLLFFTYPAFATLFCWVLDHRPPSRRQIVALGLTLLGCSLLTQDLSSEVVQPLGIALGIAAGAGYGLYLTFSGRLVLAMPPLAAAAYMLLGSTVSISLVTITWLGLNIPSTAVAVGIVSSLAIFATALPIVTLFAGLKRLGVVSAAILSTLEPVLAVLMGMLFLGESLGLRQMLGGGLIIASAIIIQARH
ncbi:MAG: EamA family transporter [Stigonema ocellatum SAG 48.90 = DSM 106950]|nr:EamA family transporter [Stigonema ocellatum SAG 48.90 = DSM 106950]